MGRMLKKPSLFFKKVWAAQAQSRMLVESMKSGRSNPSVKEEYLIAQARADAFQSVLRAMEGDYSEINCYIRMED